MKHVLLAVVGLSPQIITEALYALFHKGRPVDAIHLITTGAGAGEIFRTMLAPKGGPLEDFCQQYGIDRQSIDFSLDTLHVLTRANSESMDDIVNEEDNERLLKICLELTHQFTTDPDTVVSFLVAGGRKTMTSCLTLAAQLYGRPCDRLYHVLVSPEFENCPNFWFPPRESTMLKLSNYNKTFYMQTRYARITLVPIPFVSIRGQLDDALLDRPRLPADLIQSLVRTEPKRLTLDLANGKIAYGNIEMDMHPARLALYAFFAERKTRCDRDAPCGDCTDCWLEVTGIIKERRIYELYRMNPVAHVYDTIEEGSIGRLSIENFRSYRSKINRDLLHDFGSMAIHELEIASHGKRPDTKYGLRIDKERIRISDL